MFRFLFLAVTLALVAAFVTKPSPQDIDLILRQQLAAEIDRGAGLDAADPAAQIALGLCRVNRDACVELLAQLVRIDYEDKTLYARVTADLPGQPSQVCFGAFTRVFCPGG